MSLYTTASEGQKPPPANRALGAHNDRVGSEFGSPMEPDGVWHAVEPNARRTLCDRYGVTDLYEFPDVDFLDTLGSHRCPKCEKLARY